MYCDKLKSWDPVTRCIHPSWKAVVSPTDRPKSIHNRCEIAVFGRGFVLSFWFLEFSVGVRTFVIGLSKVSFDFSYS